VRVEWEDPEVRRRSRRVGVGWDMYISLREKSYSSGELWCMRHRHSAARRRLSFISYNSVGDRTLAFASGGSSKVSAVSDL